MDETTLHDLMEEQCILRLPDDLAKKMRERMQKNSTQAFRDVSIETLDKKGKRMRYVKRISLLILKSRLSLSYRTRKITRTYTLKCPLKGYEKLNSRFALEHRFHFFDGKTYDAQLLSLPCHVETYKAGDSGNYYKSQDVAQVLKVYAPGEAPWLLAQSNDTKTKSSRNLKDGLTPPTRNIMEKRWMKNEYSRDIPRGIQEMEDEIISYLSGKPKEIWRFVEIEDRMKDWTDGPEGHVEESMMFGAEALERT